MFKLRDRRTDDLFDHWSSLGNRRSDLLKRSWAGVFRDHLLTKLPVESLARHFHGRLGRPSKDLHVVIGVLILQQLHDLTDAATVEALAFNMAWHYALDVRGEADVYFCEKTLRNHRRLFVEQGLDEDLFRGLTDELVGGFCVDTDRQRMDSTALRSAMRSLTRLGIVVECISKFARELARFHPELHARIDPEILRRYVDREGSGSFASTAPGVSKRRLGEAGQDLLALALQFRGTVASNLPGFAILEQVLREQFEVGEDASTGQDAKTAIARTPGDIPCDGITSPADPDSSFNAHRGRGYMAQIVETYREDDGNKDGGNEFEGPSGPDLITCVTVHKMTRHDCHFLKEALDDLDGRGLKPGTLLADTHYGYSENMALVKERDVRLFAPAQTPRGVLKGRLTLEDFSLDDDGLVLSCPRGEAPASTSMAGAKLQARFDLTDCRVCPDMERCPVRAFKYEGRFARFQYTPDRVALRKRRLFEKTDAFHDVYRWRAGVEATMSRLKHQMNLGSLRIRGMPAMRHVVLLRALGLNIRRCAATINQTRASTDIRQPQIAI